MTDPASPAAADAPPNPYSAGASLVAPPPRTWRRMLRHLGPGFVLSASIVGSGELIATTRLGAEAGFITLWVVIFSCLVKVAIQLEFGKFAIYSGATTMQGLDRLPGPRFGRAGWAIWTWLALMAPKFLQVGGIVGAVVLLIHEVYPGEGAASFGERVAWSAVAVVAVALLVRGGYYKPIERWSLIMIGLFTLFTLICVIALQWTPMAVTAAEAASGLTFRLPPETLLVAIGVFGITGVGGDEIMAYNYWLIEKGYAAHTGPPAADDPAWVERAQGWIRVMKWDAILSMICYTVVTALFYLLGAAVLHRGGVVPEKDALIPVLATMYTESIGPWAKGVFLAGALVVLFSTMLAALAAWTRMFSDAFARIGRFDYSDPARRRRMIGILAWIIPSLWALLFLSYNAPSQMVIIGGVATAAILLIVVFAALVMRYRWLPAELRPSPFYDAALWVSALAILAVGIYGVWSVAG